MRLIDQMMDSCVFLNKVRADDDYGGYTETWTDGATFSAAIIKNTTTEAMIAEKSGISEIFTVVTAKGFPLEYHDVFRRVKDGEVFRITSRNLDSEAPEASTVKIAKVTAERWALPT